MGFFADLKAKRATKRAKKVYESELNEWEKENKVLTKALDIFSGAAKGDEPDGISREVLKEWGEAYLFWVNYQRKIQTIAEGCLVNLENFSSCRNQKLSQTIELERQSTAPLNAVQAKIQAWQEKYANQ